MVIYCQWGTVLDQALSIRVNIVTCLYCQKKVKYNSKFTQIIKIILCTKQYYLLTETINNCTVVEFKLIKNVAKDIC